MLKTKSTSSSMKKPLKEGDKPGTEQSKRVPKPGKLGKEIDDIFGGRKTKKPELEKPENKETKAEMAKKERKRKRKRSERDGGGLSNNNSNTRPRKRTEDGLPVFTEDELGFNKSYAGGTPLCPFDCDCCF